MMSRAVPAHTTIQMETLLRVFPLPLPLILKLLLALDPHLPEEFVVARVFLL
eukprot:m.754562 g.754562  ORF g.754562 m.754562 type:complete len:52 (+) comp59001_c0_seq4:724-879(+)